MAEVPFNETMHALQEAYEADLNEAILGGASEDQIVRYAAQLRRSNLDTTDGLLVETLHECFAYPGASEPDVHKSGEEIDGALRAIDKLFADAEFVRDQEEGME